MNKILWVCHFLPYPSTGHGALQRTHHLVRQVAKSFDVHLFVVDEVEDHEAVSAALGVKSISSIKPRTGLDKVLPMCRSLLGKSTYWERLFYHEALHAQIVSTAAVEPCLVILDTAFLAPYVKHVNCQTLIVNHHNVESALLAQRASRQGGALTALFDAQATRTAALEIEISKLAAHHWVVSLEDSMRLRSVVGDVQTFIVPNGVDVEYFSPEPRATVSQIPNSLVFAGGMDWYPNRDAIKWLAEELWETLVNANPEHSMTIVGKSPPTEVLQLARTDARIEVAGFVPDVRPFIHRAFAYLCPIRQGGGTRLKVLDALALGCPLVATGLAVDGLQLKDEVHFLQADDGDSMANALERLEREPELARELARNGRNHVIEHFSWDYIGSILVDFLSKSSSAERTARSKFSA